jgi:glycosyltransferase 2 family protein
MTRTWVSRARLLGGVVVLAVLVGHVGTGPFFGALGLISVRSLVAACAIAVLTTVCCAWRWSLVAGGLCVGLSLRDAVVAYYRSQFLNSTLPGGVAGDVHRALRHGRDVRDVGRSLRAVAWERSAGQLVQAVLTLAVLLLLPSPVRSSVPVVAVAIATGTAALGAVLLIRVRSRDVASRWARGVRTAVGDVRDGLLARGVWPGLVLASSVVVAGHTATFVIAARTAGAAASTARLVPLALLVLLAMSLPVSVGGWGPREGAAAWAFGAAGPGAAQGITTAVVYGVMALVACLPGAAVLVADGLRLSGARFRLRQLPAPAPSRR